MKHTTTKNTDSSHHQSCFSWPLPCPPGTVRLFVFISKVHAKQPKLVADFFYSTVPTSVDLPAAVTNPLNERVSY